MAIVGGGIAGASAAAALSAAGQTVCVVDKGRGPGGRMASRRHQADGASHRFDHGAPYIADAGDGALGERLEHAASRGAAACWQDPGGADLWVGVPGMSAIVQSILDGTETHYRYEVSRITRRDDGWLLEADGCEPRGPCDALIVAVPAPQAALLLGDHHATFAGAAEAARYRPIYTGMFAFAEDQADRLHAFAEVEAGRCGVAQFVHDGAKPGRGGAATAVVHMDEDWSRTNLERERPDVAEELSQLLRLRLGLPRPEVALAHRWRYARLERVGAPSATYDAASALGVAGDWTAGPDIADAFASGRRVAQELLAATG